MDRISEQNASGLRASADIAVALDDLGPLAQLPGTWRGDGFNLIARPDQNGFGSPLSAPSPDGIFLELNLTTERLTFDLIGSPIPNRGSAQPDIFISAVRYLQEISDADSGLLHVEPGFWLNVPATEAPPAEASIVRLATIPHGHAVIAQGGLQPSPGVPIAAPAGFFPYVNTIPFSSAQAEPGQGAVNPFEEYDLSNPNAFRQVDPGVTQSMVTNPNSVLQDALDHRLNVLHAEVTEITQIFVEAIPPGLPIAGSGLGNIGNIPFLVANADAAAMVATFWIEKIKPRHGRSFLQLQYSQTVYLTFPQNPANPGDPNLQIQGLGVWPHVSVATLVKI